MRVTRRVALGVLVIAVVGLACERVRSQPPPVKEKEKEDPSRILDDQTRLGDPVTHANLTLVPLLSRAPAASDQDYLVLDEAFDRKLVTVRELDSESVNTLEMENLSDRPLFVMSGEVVLGGKQDRAIGKDTVVPPHQKMRVDVFCVEHGRWTEEKGRGFRTARSLAHTELRLKANYGSQNEVWNEVAAKNAKRGAQNSTDTYRNVATERSTADAIAPYEGHLGGALARVKDSDRMVGFVAVLNGELVGVEAFDSPRLYAKLQGKLLRSYYVEAVDLPPPADPSVLGRVPTAADVRAFNEKLASGEQTTVADTPAAATEQVRDEDFGASMVIEKDQSGKKRTIYRSAHKLK